MRNWAGGEFPIPYRVHRYNSHITGRFRMATITLAEAQANLPELVRRLAPGEAVVASLHAGGVVAGSQG